eukprot:scaffold155542_cov32-Tisochrysis_lutea.AAC.1
MAKRAYSTPAPIPPHRDGSDEKLFLFSKFFYKLDPDGNGTITFEEIKPFLAFTAVGYTPAQIHDLLHKVDDGNEKLNRTEFIDLCIRALGDVTIKRLEMGAENYYDFINAKEARIIAKWRRVANDIDRWCRWWVPLAYFIALAIVYSLDLNDGYSELETPLREKLDGMSVGVKTPKGFADLIVYFLTIAGFGLTYFIIVVLLLATCATFRRVRAARQAEQDKRPVRCSRQHGDNVRCSRQLNDDLVSLST